MKTAIITGFTGMDGSHLSRLLLDKGYKVYGAVRRVSNPDLRFIKEMGLDKVVIIDMDLGDSHSVNKWVQEIQPDEFYNLAAMSHVGTSFSQPESTGNITGLGVLRCLEAIRNYSPHTKFYQASTSELFGDAPAPQNENTPFSPRSPYAVAKLYGHHMVKVYRESYNIFACAGILFNHESYRRSKDFVTRKITSWIGENYESILGMVREDFVPLQLGNLNAQRDWGAAEDYVGGMYLMLQQSTPKDYVLATGRSHTVRDFCTKAFNQIGINIEWVGTGVDEIGQDAATGRLLVQVNEAFYRPCEVNFLLGDASLANRELNWAPTKTLDEIVYNMVGYDLRINNHDYP